MSILNFSFLAPLAFLGLLAAAIPIYLHLRHKPRAEIYRFPAIDFLLKAQKKRKRRLQVEQLLLMIFRILVICLLAFVFAKPFIDEQLGSLTREGDQPMVLILDDSVSMLARTGSDSFFDAARDQIRDLARSRPGGASTFLMPASDPGLLSNLSTASDVAAAASTLKPTTSAATLDAAYQAALDLVEREDWPRATIQIFTDGSKTAWRELPASKPDKVDVIYTSMRPDDASFTNQGIAAISQSPGDINSVEIAVQNSDPAARELSLSVTGEGVPDTDLRLKVEAGARSIHRFGLSDPAPAKLSIRIDDDNFALDNEILYAPKPNRKTSILIVDGDSHPELVRGESFFIKNALGLDDSSDYGYSFDVVTPAGLSWSKIEAVDVVCILNNDVPEGDLLNRALKAGKGVFITMGDRMDYESWNRFLADYNLETYEAQQLDGPQMVTVKDWNHPLFHPVSELEWQGYFADVGIRTYRVVSMGRANFDVPLALPSGAPLLITKDLAPGRMALWTSSIDMDWNNFPLEFGYVPFVRQTLSWLASREANASYQTLTVDQVQARGMMDELSLKYTAAAFTGLDANGFKPGVYTRNVRNRTEFVQVTLDPRELDFSPFEAPASDGAAGESSLEALGFRDYLRSDLAPSLQWLLFLLILVETVVAGRLSLNWGAR